MSKARKFDDVFDECLERLLVKNETVEQCLQSFPEHSRELKPLLEMTLAARQASAVKPRSEFRERARNQFNLALREAGSKKSRVFAWGWQPRWAVAVAILVILSLVGGGTLAAAAGSMPDSPLYPVKRATEQVELTLTLSQLGKAEFQTKLANKRVSEIAYLAETGQPEKIAEITESLNGHLAKISLLVSPPGAVSSLAISPSAGRTTVPTPTPAPAPAVLPPQAQAVKPEPAGKEGASKSEKAGANVTSQEETKKGKEGERAQDERRAKLKTTVEDQAKQNIARLRALLETAPESAKPALKRALESSEAEYKKAVDALDSGKP